MRQTVTSNSNEIMYTYGIIFQRVLIYYQVSNNSIIIVLYIEYRTLVHRLA